MLLRLFRITKGARGTLLVKSLFGIMITATYVAQAILLARGVSYAFTDLRWENFAPIIVGILLLLCIRAVFLWLREIFGKYAAAKVKESIRVNLFQYFFKLGLGYMEEGRTGKIQSIFIDGVEALEVFLVNYIPQVIVTVVGLLCMIAYITRLDVSVGTSISISVLTCVLCPMFWDKLMNKIGNGHWESYGDLNSQFVDAMQGMSTLKSFNASDAMGKRLEQDATSLYHHTMEKLKVSLISTACVGLASAVGTSLSIGIGAYHMSVGILEMSALSTILFLSAECFRPITELNTFWHQSFLGFSAAEKMFEFLDSEITVKEQGKEVARLEAKELPSVTFSDVSFAYENGERPALHHFTMQIPSGAKVALVGKSGSGKSTVVNLLMRFFDYQSGTIQINGTDIKKITIHELRKQIAVVFQDTYLFYGTVADNIRMAKPEATDEEIEQCCRVANAHEFIEKLPQGYHAVVGERGTRLSGGERQRIAIARAVLKNAPILILDEATSNVDASNEQAIQESLEQLMKNKTTLIIAHRLSTIIHADEIFVLDASGLLEHGTAKELLAKKDAFASLMKAQQAGEGVE